MKHFTFALVLVAALAEPAFATHHHPQQAKLLKTTLVSAYESCLLPGTVHAPTIGLPACNPEVLTSSANATNVTTFGPTGRLAVGLKSALAVTLWLPQRRLSRLVLRKCWVSVLKLADS